MLYNEDVSFETHTGTTAHNEGRQESGNPAEIYVEVIIKEHEQTNIF